MMLYPACSSSCAWKRRERALIVSLLITVLLLPSIASAADNGFIAVSSTPPGARIFVDGVFQQATTPWKGILPQGEHTLKLTYNGYQDHEVQFMLHPLQSINFEVTMTEIPAPVTGTISVTSTPSGARVFINGVMAGITPYSGSYPAGGYTVKVTKSDYQEFGTAVIVEGGKTTAVAADLTPILPKTGTISIYSTPAGAFVTVDGIFQGSAPSTIALTPGPHSLKVSAAGYNDYVASITVTAGQTVPVYATLVPSATVITGPPTPSASPKISATASPVPSAATPAANTGQGTGETGSLLLTSRPAGANVYVDGIFIGKAPAAKRSIPTGSHAVLFTLSGYDDFATTVQVSAGETTEFAAAMVSQGQAGQAVTGPTRAAGAGLILAAFAVVACVLLRRHI